jgi:glycosyltransferase involved in cell wall biosynthesis
MKINVIVTTYNHERYIAQCLESVLKQKGDFQLEVIVGDDCSIDNTREMVDEFQNRYPLLISVLPTEKNLGITKNLKRCLDACSGEYIAICEGDDYWTDEYKLQKQMIYLQTHPDLSMCFSAFQIYYEDKKLLEPFADQVLLKKDVLTTEDLIENNYIGNFSCCMYRTDVVRKLPKELFEIFTVDWLFNMTCGQFGKIGFIREQMSVYRKHSQGAWAGREELSKLRELSRLIDVYNVFFNNKYEPLFKRFKEVVENEIRARSGSEENRHPIRRKFDWKYLLKPTYISFTRKLRGISNRIVVKFDQTASKLKHEDRQPKPIYCDLLILDTLYPHPLSPFRFEEFTEYLNHFPSSIALSTGDHLPLVKESKNVTQVIEEFETSNPNLASRVKAAPRTLSSYKPKLAYLTFLNNVLLFLDMLEETQIPFVFTLYPGGGFAIDNKSVDASLTRVFQSPQFRKVIATQKITYDYLIHKQFCTPWQVEFIYGVVTPSSFLKQEIPKKRYFGIGKNTLDICFVAHKYTKTGVDKGYDVFIESAKELGARHSNIQFHVVGGFTESDISLGEIENRVSFYGLQKPEWFDDFYTDKDIILSPNIPFRLHDGSFDGFPTASCTEAGLRNVALFCTDELNQNIKFSHGEDIVIVPYNSDRIVESIEYYYANPLSLKQLAERGAAKIRETYSYENQILPRIKILEQELMKSMAGVQNG